MTRSVVLFVVAGFCEIGGGYLVWLRLRDHRTTWLGALGGLILFFYWGWWIDGVRPDRYDLIGGTIALVGVAIIMYAPRG